MMRGSRPYIWQLLVVIWGWFNFCSMLDQTSEKEAVKALPHCDSPTREDTKKSPNYSANMELHNSLEFMIFGQCELGRHCKLLWN